MKIAVMASLFAKRNMNINASQRVYDLMNNFIQISPSLAEAGRGVRP
jgi:hypothetical protein